MHTNANIFWNNLFSSRPFIVTTIWRCTLTVYWLVLFENLFVTSYFIYSFTYIQILWFTERFYHSFILKSYACQIVFISTNVTNFYMSKKNFMGRISFWQIHVYLFRSYTYNLFNSETNTSFNEHFNCQ